MIYEGYVFLTNFHPKLAYWYWISSYLWLIFSELRSFHVGVESWRFYHLCFGWYWYRRLRGRWYKCGKHPGGNSEYSRWEIKEPASIHHHRRKLRSCLLPQCCHIHFDIEIWYIENNWTNSNHELAWMDWTCDMMRQFEQIWYQDIEKRQLLHF